MGRYAQLFRFGTPLPYSSGNKGTQLVEPEPVHKQTGTLSRIKDQGSWTLFWHEWASWKRYGRDIKTVQIYNRRPIILYRFYKDQIKDQGSWTLFWHNPC